MKIAQASVNAQEERNKTLKRHYEIALFTNVPAECDNREAVEYFRIRRARALAVLHKEESLNATIAETINPKRAAFTKEHIESSFDA